MEHLDADQNTTVTDWHLLSMVVELVPVKGGIGSIFHPPEGKDYKCYMCYISGIFPANWGIICYLPPFRGTISTTIDINRFKGA